MMVWQYQVDEKKQCCFLLGLRKKHTILDCLSLNQMIRTHVALSREAFEVFVCAGNHHGAVAKTD